MIQINTIRQNPQDVIDKLAVKNFDAAETVKAIVNLDIERRKLQATLEEKLAEGNKIAKEIGILFKTGKADDAKELKLRSAELKIGSKEIEDRLSRIESEQNDLIVLLPNLPHQSVRTGKTADDNEIIYNEGNILPADENILPHWELLKVYDIIDFDAGSKISGAGFPIYKEQGAKLQRALINFFLDEATAAGYSELQTPYVVNEASAFGTGQLPDKDGQMYYIQADNLYLIPTAEVPVTNYYRDTILKEEQLPVRNVAYSACFRREAGSYGKDVRGLNRLHQFDKVEIVQLAHPDKSYLILEEMKEYVAGLLRKLKLPFRIVRLCGGDLSFTSALTYDFEVFSVGQQRWLEVSSVSNFETFQSNRMKLRFKDKDGKSKLIHTLNGSALALPRIVAALLENNQTDNGIAIPECLINYTKFNIITKK